MAISIKIYKNDVEYDITNLVSLPLTLTNTLDETLDSGSFEIPIIDDIVYFWNQGESISLTEQVSPVKGDIWYNANPNVEELFEYNGTSWFVVPSNATQYAPTDINQYWVDITNEKIYTSILFNFYNRIERLTKVIIEIDNVTYRYLVSEDKVTIIKKTSPRMYSHSVSLIEPTKLLERRVIPDMTITQPTGSTLFNICTLENEGYLVDGSLDDGNIANKQILPLTTISNADDTGKINNATLVEAGRTYNIQVDLNAYNGSYLFDNYLLVELVINGVVSSSNISFNFMPNRDVGDKNRVYDSINTEYTSTIANELVQIRVSQLEGNSSGNVNIDQLNLTILTKDSLIGVKTFLDETVDKILNITKLSDLNDSSFIQEFTLGAATRNKISTILTPEITFQRYTMWDSLKDVANIVKAIPRLGGKDFTTIEFDFVDEFNEDTNYNIDNYTSLIKNAYLNDYVSGLIINADNVIEVEDSINRKIEPYAKGWMSLRGNAEGPIELRESNTGLVLRQKIYKITKVEVRGIPITVTDGVNFTSTDVWDISPHIFESKFYNSLSDEDITNTASRNIGATFKGNTLYYSQGDNRLLGFSNLGKYEDTILNNKIPERAIYEAVYTVAQKYLYDNSLAGTVDDSTNLAIENFDNILFRVEYIPIQNVRAAVMRQDARSFETESFRYVNESAPVVDSDNLGEYSKALANKLGNEVKTYTGFSEAVNTIPKTGYLLDSGEVIISNTIAVERNISSFSIDVYEDYATISDFVGVDSAYRQYEVPDKDTVFRQDRYRDYLVIDKVDRVSKHHIYTGDALELMLENFIGGAAPSSYTPISYGIMRTRESALNPGDAGWTTYDREVDLTVNTTNFGTTLVITTELENNWSAGPRAANGVTDTDYSGNPIAIPADYENALYQQDVRYTDNFGMIDSARIEFYTFGDDVVLFSDMKQYPEFRSLNTIDGVKVSQLDVRMLKDAREKYGWVQELNFTSDDSDIRVYSGMAKYNGLSALKTETDIGAVLLLNDYFPNPNVTHINLNKVLPVTLTSSSVIIRDDVNGVRSQLSFGFTSPGSYNGYAFINKTTGELLFAVKEGIVTGAFTDDLFFVPNTAVGEYVDLDPTGVNITTPSQSIIENNSIQLNYELVPWYAESGVTWSISNVIDFSIDANGLLTSINDGSTFVTITTDIGLHTDQITITAQPEITALSIDAHSGMLYTAWGGTSAPYYPIYDTEDLTVTVSPVGAYINDLVWSSSDESIVEVDQTGKITSTYTPGTATITITDARTGLFTSMVATTRIEPYGIAISGSANMYSGATQQLTYTLYPSTAYDDIYFIELDGDVGYFGTTAEGQVTAVSSVEGSIIIRALSSRNGVFDNFNISSTFPPVSQVTVTANTNPMTTGTINQMTATLTPSNSVSGITWSVSSPTYFSIDEYGVLSATHQSSPISTWVYGRSDNDILGSLLVTANPPDPTDIYIASGSVEVYTNSTYQYTYDLIPFHAGGGVTWSVSNPLFSVTQSGILTSSFNPGSTDLTVTTDIGSHTDTWTIVADYKPPTSIKIDTDALHTNIAGTPWTNPNESVDLDVIFTPSDANAVLRWSLPDQFSGASLNSVSGLYNPNGERGELIDVNGGGLYHEILLSSIWDDPTSINVSGNSVMVVGSQQQLSSTVSPVSGDPDISWYKDDPGNNFTMSSSGYISAIDVGTCTVTGTGSGGAVDSITITSYVSSGGGCLDRNTLIPMWDGSVQRLRTIEPGDVVVGYMIDGMIDESIEGWEEWTTEDISSGVLVPAVVKHSYSDSYKEYYIINEDIKITKAHPLFIKQNDVYGWVDSPDINIGDFMINQDGEEVEITSIEFIPEELNVITMNVEEIDNYFAGNSRVLVHNTIEKG